MAYLGDVVFSVLKATQPLNAIVFRVLAASVHHAHRSRGIWLIGLSNVRRCPLGACRSLRASPLADVAERPSVHGAYRVGPQCVLAASIETAMIPSFQRSGLSGQPRPSCRRIASKDTPPFPDR